MIIPYRNRLLRLSVVSKRSVMEIMWQPFGDVHELLFTFNIVIIQFNFLFGYAVLSLVALIMFCKTRTCSTLSMTLYLLP